MSLFREKSKRDGITREAAWSRCQEGKGRREETEGCTGEEELSNDLEIKLGGN